MDNLGYSQKLIVRTKDPKTEMPLQKDTKSNTLKKVPDESIGSKI